MLLLSTDQRDCYNETGAPIPCSGSGQDGETRCGLEWNDQRFSVTGALVSDRVTGRIWSGDAGEGPLSWPQAFGRIDEMNRDRAWGRKDWRLPERRELFSLVSHSRINPAVVIPEGIENLFNGYYWTATHSARLEDQAWTVHLGGGRLVRGMKHRDAMVLPVAGKNSGFPDGMVGEIPAEKVRFTSVSGLVSDHHTGLMWLQNPGGAALSWSQALESIFQLNNRQAHGFDDWRLPNIRELESLVALDRHSPALDPSAGFAGVGRFYWSATTSVYTPSYAWALYTQDGMVGVGYKPNPEFGVWPVRSL